MQRTIFNTPIVNGLLKAFSVGYLKLTGWKIEGSLPPEANKSVLIAAPHTSNWDLPYTLMVAFALDLQVRWMGKQSIFNWPFGGLMRWLGGIAVDRSQSNNLVAASADSIRNASGPLQLVVPPGHTQQNPLLENRFLLHRPGCQRAHRDGLHGLQPQGQRPGAHFPAHRRHRKRHGRHQGVLCPVQGQERTAV